MSNYPNIEAIANGTISGKFQEWSRVKPEAIAILEELKRLEGLILLLALLSDEAKRIRAKREECRVCATKAVGLPTPGYTHDESCAQREEKK